MLVLELVLCVFPPLEFTMVLVCLRSLPCLALFCFRQIPLGRMGTTFDIGMGAVFLLSSAAAYVSGDTLVRNPTHEDTVSSVNASSLVPFVWLVPTEWFL